MARNDSTVARRPLLDGPGDYLIVLVVVVVVFVTAGTWATGQLAGLVTHAAWPPVSFGSAFAVAQRLPHHADDPRQAWPADARSDLPGPVGFVVAGVLVLAVMGTLTWWAVRSKARNRQHRGMASYKQLARRLSAQAVVRRGHVVRPSLAGVKIKPEQVAVPLGRTLAGLALWAIVESSVLLLAAPRQGKTTQVIIPWLRIWQGPALVTSLRSDVLEATARIRRALGPVYVMAPTGMVAWPDTVQWSPSSRCEDFGTAMQRSDLMVQIGKSETTDSSGAGFFGATATSLLAGWLHAAAITGRSMQDVLRWAYNPSIEEPIKLLVEAPGAEPGVAEMMDSLYRNPSDTRANLFATVQTALTPLFSPAARAVFAPPPGQSLDIENLLLANGTVYLLVEELEARSLAPLISAFVDEVTQTAKRIADRSPGGRLDPPLAMLLDEVANISPLPHLPQLLSFSGGSGMFVVAVIQSMAQARSRWGQEGADMLWGAATLKVSLGGLTGKELDELSKLSGIYRESMTTYQSGTHGTTMQTSLQDRKTLTPDQIRTLDEELREAVIVHATTPVTKVIMQRHYESPQAQEYAAAVQWAREYRQQAERPAA